MTREQPRVHVPGDRCPFCHETVPPAAAEKVACNACMAWHHEACWQEHGACSACGAAHTGLAEPVVPAPRSGHTQRPGPFAIAAAGFSGLVLAPVLTLLGTLLVVWVTQVRDGTSVTIFPAFYLMSWLAGTLFGLCGAAYWWRLRVRAVPKRERVQK